MSNKQHTSMGQSLACNYIHITFCTKGRFNLIDSNIEEELFSYIGGICKKLECNPIKVGGYQNHIHILCMLSKKIALIQLLEKIKANSSKWIKTKGNKYSNFYWQSGYGSFSVNPLAVNTVKNYIETQKEHHKTKTFQEEYLEYLNSYNVEYDERYVWD